MQHRLMLLPRHTHLRPALLRKKKAAPALSQQGLPLQSSPSQKKDSQQRRIMSWETSALKLLGGRGMMVRGRGSQSCYGVLCRNPTVFHIMFSIVPDKELISICIMRKCIDCSSYRTRLGHKSINPKSLNPKSLNPSTDPKILKPKSLNPSTPNPYAP